jgi:hypothetical protein
MSGLSDMLIEEPWTRRVRAESAGRQPSATEAGDAPETGVGAEPPGWDPCEVWLHRIQRPRKPRGLAAN